MRGLKREHRTDPVRYDVREIGTLPVEYTNYLIEQPSLIAPGARSSSGCGTSGTRSADVSQASSAGIRRLDGSRKQRQTAFRQFSAVDISLISQKSWKGFQARGTSWLGYSHCIYRFNHG